MAFLRECGAGDVGDVREAGGEIDDPSADLRRAQPAALGERLPVAWLDPLELDWPFEDDYDDDDDVDPDYFFEDDEDED